MQAGTFSTQAGALGAQGPLAPRSSPILAAFCKAHPHINAMVLPRMGTKGNGKSKLVWKLAQNSRHVFLILLALELGLSSEGKFSKITLSSSSGTDRDLAQSTRAAEAPSQAITGRCGPPHHPPPCAGRGRPGVRRNLVGKMQRFRGQRADSILKYLTLKCSRDSS